LRPVDRGTPAGGFPGGRFNLGPGFFAGYDRYRLAGAQIAGPVYPVFIHNARKQSMLATLYAFRPVRITTAIRSISSAYYGRRTSPELLQEVTDLLMGAWRSWGASNTSRHLQPQIHACDR